MCGIVGGFAPDIFPFLRDGLLRLEYRGYDSWGMAVLGEGPPQVVRWMGPPSSFLPAQSHLSGTCGIAHTRWASHGRASLENAHPISGGRGGEVLVVHNGIIENYAELREFLTGQGYTFKTETDTETIAHLLAHYMGDPLDAGAHIKHVCATLQGRYAFAAVLESCPGRIFLASFGSPLVVCPEAGLFASDPVALSGYVPDDALVFALENEAAILDVSEGRPRLSKDMMGPLRGVRIPPANAVSTKTRGQWMLEEMREQVEMARSGPRPAPALDADCDEVGGIHLFGCGSSYHAALLGRAYFEARAATPVTARLATDFPRYVYADHAYVAVTQSGETADVLAVLEKLPDHVAPHRINVLTNRPHSTAARLGNVLEVGCGEERAVAATKSFLATCLRLLELSCVYLGKQTPDYAPLADAIERVLGLDLYQETDLFRAYRHYYVCGKGLMYPVALEGALKFKECAYRHCEGLHLSEVKHGPLACFNNNALVVVLVGGEQDLSGLSEIAARPCRVLALTHEEMAGRVRDVVGPHKTISLPTLHAELQPLLFAVYLQRLSYELGMLGGHDPDLPRHISKSISVE
jgi:glucosamine--fructose-6-phosphate aminotransferase (isomerizing)